VRIFTERIWRCSATHCNLRSSAMQCVAVCCSVLQCVAVCCSVLQYGVVCYSVLQCVALLRNALQLAEQHKSHSNSRNEYSHKSSLYIHGTSSLYIHGTSSLYIHGTSSLYIHGTSSLYIHGTLTRLLYISTERACSLRSIAKYKLTEILRSQLATQCSR